jgi:hypothetical protein
MLTFHHSVTAFGEFTTIRLNDHDGQEELQRAGYVKQLSGAFTKDITQVHYAPAFGCWYVHTIKTTEEHTA